MKINLKKKKQKTIYSFHFRFVCFFLESPNSIFAPIIAKILIIRTWNTIGSMRVQSPYYLIAIR